MVTWIKPCIPTNDTRISRTRHCGLHSDEAWIYGSNKPTCVVLCSSQLLAAWRKRHADHTGRLVADHTGDQSHDLKDLIVKAYVAQGCQTLRVAFFFLLTGFCVEGMLKCLPKYCGVACEEGVSCT